MDEELVSFLDEPGVIEILCVIPIDGISRGEIIDKVRITGKTVDKRMEKGERLGLWEREASHRDVQAQYDYFLTEYGTKVQIAVAYHQLPTIFGELRMKHQEFERQKDVLKERIGNVGLEQFLQSVDSKYSR